MNDRPHLYYTSKLTIIEVETRRVLDSLDVSLAQPDQGDEGQHSRPPLHLFECGVLRASLLSPPFFVTWAHGPQSRFCDQVT